MLRFLALFQILVMLSTVMSGWFLPNRNQFGSNSTININIIEEEETKCSYEIAQASSWNIPVACGTSLLKQPPAEHPPVIFVHSGPEIPPEVSSL